jgi:hypothetical protein
MDDGPRQGNSRPVTPSWQGDRMLQAISDRLTRSATIALLLSPAGLLIIAAARLLIISDYNTATASAIVSSSGYVNTLLGTIIPLIPIIMPYLALILLFFNRVIPGILALVATAFISPTAVASRPAITGPAAKDWNQIVNTHFFFFIGLLVAVAVLMLAGVGFNTCMRTIATIVCIALIPTIAHLYPLPFNNGFYAQFVRQPWLPAETLTLSSGQKIVGYSLSDDGTWTEVLLDDTRTIHFYPASDVAGRQVCQIGQVQPMQPPLVTLTSGGTSVSPRTPACQESPAAPSSPAPPSKPIPMRGPLPTLGRTSETCAKH